MNEKPTDPVAAYSFDTILRSQETGDYALFASVMNDTMKAAIPRERFDGVCARMSSYFKAPYQSAYMGDLRHGASTVYFWKITAEGKSDDLLGRMSLRDGLVSGLLFTPPFDSALGRRKDA